MTTPSRSPQPASIDTTALKRQTNLLTLVGSPLHRIAGTQGGEYSGPCPFCGGTDRFHVQPNRPDGGLWMCRQCTEGQWADAIAFVMRRDNVPFPEAVRRLGGPPSPPAVPLGPTALPARRKPGPVVATYAYRDERGDLLFQVLRHHPKDFTQRRPDGRGGWIYRLEDTRRVLYNLPKVAAAPPEEPIWVCEGEKDADRLIAGGLVATTNPHGAKKWRPEYTATLAGRSVVLVPHHDPPGLAHAAEITAALAPVTDRVKVLTLPDLPPGGKDVSDWLDADHTLDELLALAKATPRVATPAPPPPPPAPPAPRPLIRADGEIHDVRDAILAALTAANDPPTLFQRGRNLVRVVTIPAGEHSYPQLEMFVPDSFRPRISEVAQLVRYRAPKRHEDSDGPVAVPVDATRDQIGAVLSAPVFPFPVLEALTDTPTVRPDGTIHSIPGYDPSTRLIYAPPPTLQVPPVPDCPTPADVTQARTWLLDELLVDFPFSGDAERANAVALFLLPFIRSLIAGPTPLHLIESPTPGSGKSLLAEMLLTPAFGHRLVSDTDKADEEETAKWLTAKFHKGDPAIWIDNIRAGLNNSVLASALTTPVWSGRLLGASATVDVPVRAVWVATGNNLTLSTEIARRTVRIRIDPHMDRPQLRTGFKHDNLRAWIAAHRGDLVWAALTLVRAWVAAGRPAGTQRLGSYEEWATILGGILAVAAIPGFLTNVLEVYDLADNEGSQWRALLALWGEKYQSTPVGVSELFELAGQVEGFDLGRATTERAQKVTFGKALARQRDRIYGNVRVEFAGTEHRAAQWALVRQCAGECVNISECFSPLRVCKNQEKKNTHIYMGVETFTNLPTFTDLPDPAFCPQCREPLVWTGAGWACGATHVEEV